MKFKILLLTILLHSISMSVSLDTLCTLDIRGLSNSFWGLGGLTENYLLFRSNRLDSNCIIYDYNQKLFIDTIDHFYVEKVLEYNDTVFIVGRPYNINDNITTETNNVIMFYQRFEKTLLLLDSIYYPNIGWPGMYSLDKVYSTDNYYLINYSKYDGSCLRINKSDLSDISKGPRFDFIKDDTIYITKSSLNRIELIPINSNPNFDIYAEWSTPDPISYLHYFKDSTYIGTYSGKLAYYIKTSSGIVKQFPVKNRGEYLRESIFENKYWIQNGPSMFSSYCYFTFRDLSTLNNLQDSFVVDLPYLGNEYQEYIFGKDRFSLMDTDTTVSVIKFNFGDVGVENYTIEKKGNDQITINPNPFNPSTNIQYKLENSGLVSLAVYDINGKLVKILINEIKQQGNHSICWNADKSHSGIYIFKLKIDNKVQSSKGMLIK